MTPQSFLTAREGYNAAASYYDQWAWQEYWKRNEVPVVIGLAGLPGPSARCRALDVGTGTGTYFSALQSRGWFTVGVDLSERMLERARARGCRALLQADVRALPFRSGALDLAVCCRVLTHVPDLRLAFGELERVLCMGGRLVVTLVASEHDYEATCIPAPPRDIRIETFKWSAQAVIDSARACGLRCTDSVSLDALSSVWLPGEAVCRSLDRSGRRPVGNCFAFSKEAG